MTIHLDKSEGGWIANTTEKIDIHCPLCKNEMNEHDCFYWEDRKKLICRDCAENPKVYRGRFNQEVFWHIIKIKEQEGKK